MKKFVNLIKFRCANVSAATGTLKFFLIFYSLFLLILSLFRNATADETYYLLETLLMSHLIKTGVWFGDYGVGLHGFLFKLPVALIYLITGPSVFVATLFNIILIILSLVVFNQILKEHLKFGNWTIYIIILLAFSFSFVQTAPTYLREGPLLFSLLLFIKYFLKRKGSLVLGLLALLVLDAKEYVFFILVPSYVFWLFYTKIILNKRNYYKNLKEYFFKIFIFLLPSVVYLFLMFCSSFIPINMFVAYILGFIGGGSSAVINQFNTQISTQNLVDSASKTIQTINLQSSSPLIFNHYFSIVINFINILLKYIGKIVYPRTFSFISIPLIIIIPSLIASIVLFKDWLKKKKHNLLFLQFFYWGYLLFFVLRASHGRYLLTISPIALYFFVAYLKSKNWDIFRLATYISTPFILLSFLFEEVFILHKIILNLVIFLCIYLSFRIQKNRKTLQNIIFLIITSCILIPSLYFSYNQGQINSFLKWGYNQETKKIASYINPSDVVLINNFGSDNLYSFYSKSLYIEPEWHWKLKSWIPKKHLLKTVGEQTIFYFDTYNDIAYFKKQISQNKINKVIFITSTKFGTKFFMKNEVKKLGQTKWFDLINTVRLKNKKVYLFSIITK